MAEEELELITFDGDVITKSDFRDEIIDMYIDANLDGLTKITDFSIGSEAYHLADVMASFILEHRELIDLNYQMSMIHTAAGEFLDNFGDMAGVHRIGSSPSVGTVVFTRLSEDKTSEIIIPDGAQISTDDAISFVVDNDGEDLVIDIGGTEVEGSVICEQEGAYTNVNPNTITLVMGDLGNLVSVTNPEKMTEGADIEDDDDYRARILLSPYEVPTGTLAWYENLAITPTYNGNAVVHDVRATKGITQLDGDVVICFNPTNWEDLVVREDINAYNEDNSIESTATATMTRARAELVDLFTMKEYDVVGVDTRFTLANKVSVLKSDSNVTYIFAVLLENNYSINMVKDAIIEKITNFNGDAMISLECSPSVLASIIENEVDGVTNCRIVAKEGNKYTEIIEPITMAGNEVYNVDLTDIENRIQKLSFNVDIQLEE